MENVENAPVTYDDIGRIYTINNIPHYSVTTMLGATGDKGFLDGWRNFVGHEKADEITRKAANLGTEFHALGEAYLKSKRLPKVQWMAHHFFNQAKKELDKHITEVKAVECGLYNSDIKLAGRCDAVVRWDGILSIFDFKCINHDNPKWLHDYWIQTTVYQHMYQTMYDEAPKQLVLLCANKKAMRTQVFIDYPANWSQPAVERIKEFHKIIEKK